MRIDSSIAVSGKVFGRGDDPGRLGAFSKRSSEACDLRRIFTIRPHIDHGISSIVVYINYGGEYLLDSERACFTRSYLALTARKFRVAGSGNRHVPGKVYGVVKTHSCARFEIGGDEQWIMGQLLHAIAENHRFINGTAKENQATDFVVFDVMFESAIRIGILVEKR